MNNLVCGTGLLASSYLSSRGFFSLSKTTHTKLKRPYSLTLAEKYEIAAEISDLNADSLINASGPSNVGESFEQPTLYVETPELQCAAHLEILSLMKKPLKYIFISSGSVYGDHGQNGCPENQMTSPISPYAEGKIRAERYLALQSHQYGGDITVLRLYSAYSDALKTRLPGIISDHLKSNEPIELFGTGAEVRDFIRTDDLVRITNTILMNDFGQNFNILNIGTGSGVTIAEVCEIATSVASKIAGNVGNLFTFSGKIRIGDPTVMVANIDKIRSLGVEPRISSQKGLEEYFRCQLVDQFK